MTEDEIQKIIRKAMNESRGKDAPVAEYNFEPPPEPISTAKQLPAGLLSFQNEDIPGTDGKFIGLRGDIPLPVGSLSLNAGMMPTFGQKSGSVAYSVPAAGGDVSLNYNVATDPRSPEAMKSIGANYSKKLLEDWYLNAYIQQALGQRGAKPQIGIGIQGLF